MKELTIDECKERELEILKYFDALCRKYGIKYSLSYGTLLGCVRHKGFIPWDDDIDIMMTRGNYEKFLSVYKDDKYLLVRSTGSMIWLPMFARLTDPDTYLNISTEPGVHHGVWVALIIVDNIPDDEATWMSVIKTIDVYNRFINIAFDGCSKKAVLVKEFLRLFMSKSFHHRLVQKVEKIRSSYNNQKTKQMSTWVAGTRYICFPSSVMAEYINMPFEDMNAMVCKDYDTFLKVCYGDYMTPPPIEQRIPLHNYKAYQK